MSPNADAQAEKQRELLFEYEQLRKEILENFSLGVQILGGTVTFVAVIMTLGFSGAVQSYSAKAALFFVGESIAFIGMLQTMSLARSTFRIASYLRVFTEVGLDFVKWETRLHKFRRPADQSPECAKSRLPLKVFRRLADRFYKKFRRLAARSYKEVTGSVRYTYAFIIVVNFILGSTSALLDAVPNSNFRGFLDIHNLVRNGFSESPSTGAFISLTFLITVSLLWIAWRQYGKFVTQYDDTYMRRWEAVRKAEVEAADENT